MLHIWYRFITTLIDTGEQKAIFIRERGRGIQEMTAISSFFEQKMLLIGQEFHSVTFYRRQNILSNLIDNLSKVNEISKDSDMALDDISSKCFFSDKSEEKLHKGTNAKQKSKLIFGGLQRKSSTTLVEHQVTTSPFVRVLYPDSVLVVVESISSELHPKELKKTAVVSEKAAIRQD